MPALTCCATLGCVPTGLFCENHVASRQANESNTVEIVVIERNCGATTSIAHSVGIVPAGTAPDDDSIVFLADKVNNLRVRWTADASVLISYDEAQIHHFKNFWLSQRLADGSFVVAIEERQGSAMHF